MKYRFPFLAVLSLLLLGGCLTIHTAQVKIKDGEPCFTVENNAATRRNPPTVTSVSLYAEEGRRTVFSRNFPLSEKPLILSPALCLKFSEIAPGITLEKQIAYSLNIDALLNEDIDLHMAYFCLIENAEGQTDLIELDRENRKDGRWRACESGFCQTRQ